jgi:hypothetical protein
MAGRFMTREANKPCALRYEDFFTRTDAIGRTTSSCRARAISRGVIISRAMGILPPVIAMMVLA